MFEGDSRADARQPERLALIAAIGGLAIVGIHVSGLLGRWSPATLLVLGTFAPFVVLVGVQINKPARRWPWLLIAAAMVLFLLKLAVQNSLGTFGVLSERRSVLPEIIAFVGYAVAAAGVIGLVRARRDGSPRNLDALLDSAIAAVAALALAWVHLITPALHFDEASTSLRLALASLPAVSVFMVAVMAQVAFTSRFGSSWAITAVLIGMGFMLMGDVVQTVAQLQLASVPVGLLDTPYALSYVCLFAAVLHPSMRELTQPAPPQQVTPRQGRLAFVAVGLAMPVLVIVSRTRNTLGDRVALGLIIVTLTSIATWRMWRALRLQARSEERMTHHAAHDPLTDLPNRSQVIRDLDARLSRASASGQLVSALHLDIDRFKLVNDTLGHAFGDELLVNAARRLQLNAGPDDLVARIDGDSFVIVIDGIGDIQQAIRRAEDFRLLMRKPFVIQGIESPATCSVGVATSSGSEGDPDAQTLLRDADMAMYEAKRVGRDHVAKFDDEIRTRASERLMIEAELRHALDRGQLHLHYQPIVGCPEPLVEGFEALLRWSHPTWGSVSPLTFIPVSEETGLIDEIGSWVLDEACRQIELWRGDIPAGNELSVAVNVSMRQLRDPGFVELVGVTLRRHGLPGDALIIELTESTLVDDPNAAAVTLDELRALGVRLSIDDFGTGYSSLSYLKRFPVDRVKIDRSFVDGLGTQDSSEESLVAAIVAMAGALGMSTVAEGVETTVQADRLIDLGCDAAQGFLYSRPVDSQKVPGVVAHLGTSISAGAPIQSATETKLRPLAFES
jgi:diguanylate cyclase (GGDEF)-like protein